jgi:hypothetical protein
VCNHLVLATCSEITQSDLILIVAYEVCVLMNRPIACFSRLSCLSSGSIEEFAEHMNVVYGITANERMVELHKESVSDASCCVLRGTDAIRGSSLRTTAASP